MRIAGTWKRRVTYVDLPQPLPEIDQAHSQNQPGDPRTGAWGAPPLADVDPDPESARYLFEQVDWVAHDIGGGPLDVTPVDHNTGASYRSYADDVSYLAASSAAHNTDYGADRVSTYGAPPFQASDERYISTRFEGNGPVALNPQVFTRGLNGLSDNNPDGFRRGMVEQFWVDRKFHVGERVHSMRLLTPDSPYVPQDQPVPDRAGPYNSPFSLLARAITNVNQKPMMRREPPPVDQDIITDGSGQVYADPYGSGVEWVTG